MSRTLNKVMLIGNVGKDPEVHFTPSGVKVAQLRLATSETWKDKDGAVQEHTDWHTIIAWRGLADVVERLVRRGSRLYVEGKIQSRSFDDRDGNKKYVTEIIADSLLVLDAKRQDQPANTNETEQSLHTSSGTDVIPF
jgi:single-strand DNA-binding protein